MSIEDSLIRHQIFLERYAGTISKMMQNGIDKARNEALVITAMTSQDILNFDPITLRRRLYDIVADEMLTAFIEIQDLTRVEADFIKRVVERDIKEELENVSNEVLVAALVNKNMPVGLANKTQNRNIEVAYDKFAEQSATQLAQPILDMQATGGDPLDSANTITALAAGLLAVQARSLSRASVVHASNTSKDSIFKANADKITHVEWVSVLDSRTTNFCRNQDKKRYKIGEGPRPPAHYNCFDKLTDVLTDEGWKNWQDVTGNELFLSVDLETGDADYVAATKLIKQKADKLVSYKNNNVNIVTTEDHMHVVKFRQKQKGRADAGIWQLVDGRELPNHDFNFLATIPNWQGKKEETLEYCGKEISSLAFMAFLGIYLSEGSISKVSKNSYRVSIHQEKYFDEFVEICLLCFGEDRVKYYRHLGKIHIRPCEDLVNLLLPLGHSHEKYIPTQFKEYDKEHLDEFLHWFTLGDGSFQKSNNSCIKSCMRVEHTSSKRLADDLSELMLKIGKRPSFQLTEPKTVKHHNGTYTGNHNMWHINECHGKSHSRDRMSKTEIDYYDYTYDVSLEKWHTLIVRREGQVYVSGNCRSITKPVLI